MPPAPEARLTVAVQPRAGRDGIVGWRDGVLRVRVTAPPAAGAANAAVRALLANRLGCAPGRVEILRGAGARTKILRIAGLSASDVALRLGEPS